MAIFVACLALAAHAPSAHAASPATSLPVTGVFEGGTFVGTLDITRFRASHGVLTAVGLLSGDLLDESGNVIGSVSDTRVTLPVAAPAALAAAVPATCSILHLELGPLDLDLLGLVVHLDRVVLDLHADAAPGNLLGNLLCAVAHLLDVNGPLAAVAQILNRILDILSTL